MFRNLVLFCIVVAKVRSSVFDEDLYERVLDPEECDRQLQFLANDSLIIQFIDSSGKIPPGILKGNLNDLGDYYQCLDIYETKEVNMTIEGKYCSITIPLDQGSSSQLTRSGDVIEEKMRRYSKMKESLLNAVGIDVRRPSQRMVPSFSPTYGLTVAVCLPKVCTVRQVMGTVLDRLTFLNVSYTENYCRLPNDKPLVAADYVAIVTFSLIGLITLISSSYDLYQQFVLKRSSSQMNPLFRCFSVYTNTRRFLTFSPPAGEGGTLDCLDGIRSLSMLWVIIGHTFIMTLVAPLHNIMEAFKWTQSFSSIWVISAPITVDTFFFLSGILCVYTTIGKIGQATFLRKIPMFWLHRLLRMFPLLASTVLLQASLVSRAGDGPVWGGVAAATEACRRHWWAALLHIQNYYNTFDMCLTQTWYLSVDVQLYLACPAVLAWALGGRRWAWAALALSLAAAFISATVYSFTYDFPASLINLSRVSELGDYGKHYYMNTLTRAPPFCVGMLCGYLLHVCRDRTIRIRKMHNAAVWVISFTVMSFVIFINHPLTQPDHDAQTLDNLLNSYMRGAWALALSWLVFACVHGYGGPINWFLSLRVWKLPARLSYAMYLLHFPILFLEGGSYLKTFYFTVSGTIFRFMAVVSLTALASLVLCVTIDAPCSTLQKLLLDVGRKSNKPESLESIAQIDKPNRV